MLIKIHVAPIKCFVFRFVVFVLWNDWSLMCHSCVRFASDTKRCSNTLFPY